MKCCFISGEGSGGKRRWSKWNKAEKNVDECVKTSDKEDVSAGLGKSKKVGKERGKPWARQQKKIGKSRKWNRSHKGATEYV